MGGRTGPGLPGGAQGRMVGDTERAILLASAGQGGAASWSGSSSSAAAGALAAAQPPKTDATRAPQQPATPTPSSAPTAAGPALEAPGAAGGEGAGGLGEAKPALPSEEKLQALDQARDQAWLRSLPPPERGSRAATGLDESEMSLFQRGLAVASALATEVLQRLSGYLTRLWRHSGQCEDEWVVTLQQTGTGERPGAGPCWGWEPTYRVLITRSTLTHDRRSRQHLELALRYRIDRPAPPQGPAAPGAGPPEAGIHVWLGPATT
ncbi:hypothetical protein PAPYR_3033 [Paratrimastix pyriformis]|uniref:Uncharacterized protein n=1 Tax=Paratrimastix pyriformis TaxID=342808 RepID=A0ABQ8UVK4_9EUKA|nr:hypothetical protein PAPYR_3033 [Paratrimastix pyriformis]